MTNGQQSSFSPNSLLSQSSISQWNGDNGLISNNITSAIRDHNGFVWITSYNGIMQFDGAQIYIYDKSKIPFLSTGAFYGVYEDSQGRLWFTSQNSGLIRYSNGKFEKIDTENKILSKSIRCLLFSNDGVVWIGSNYSGLFKLKNNAIEKVDCPELNNSSILDITQDLDNNLWIASEGKGLYKYDGRNFENIKGLSSTIASSVCITKDNAVLIGTQNGLDILMDQKVYHHPRLVNFQVNKVVCDEQNRIWVGTEIGLARFKLTDDGSYEYITERDGFPLSRINCLHFDKENSLWISTGRDGLIQLREPNIVNITTQQGLSQNKINMIAEASGKFYIGSDAGSVDVYSHGEVSPIKLQTPLNDSGVRDIYCEPDGTLWIASYRGILKKSKHTEKFFGLNEGLPAVDVRRILPGDNGDLYFASRSGGVIKFNNGKVVEVYDKDHGLSSNYVLALEKDKSGNLYIGTHSGGLSILNSNGKIKTFHIENDDAGILIFNIHIDNHNKVWIVSNLGLQSFDGNRFKNILLQDEQKGVIYFDWLEDNLGNVWITSNVGVLKIIKNDIERFIQKETQKVKFKLFDNRDGMRSKECTSTTRGLVSASGKVWIPTINGISIFYPEKIHENKIPPPVFITHLKADNVEIEGNQPLKIDPGKLRYKFNFTAPSFIVPAKTQFKYKLDRVDDNWINAGTSREAEYTNLSPGSYVFRVNACNNDGVWNEKGAEIRFKILPFFYQTAAFYVLLIIASMILLYSAYKWRVNVIEMRNMELRKVNGELDRFVYSASHDLRAPLASVLGLVNVARLDEGKNFDLYLRKIEASILKLDGFVRDIIDFSRNARVEVASEPIEFENLIHEIIDNLMYLDEKDQIRRVVKVEGHGIFLSDKKRLSVVLNNLISNAIKYFNPHEQDSFLEVSVVYDQTKAVIKVKDNGIGILPEHIANIFKMFYRADAKSRGSGIGLYIVKETLDKINGKISVQSEYGKGSTFTVTLVSLSHLPQLKSERGVSKSRPAEIQSLEQNAT